MSKDRHPPIDVLVVDDSAVVRQLMTSLLGAQGVRVTSASDPLVAMAKMRRHRPNVIVLDLEMPRMDGITFLKQLMSTDPIPVVVCSGFAEPGTNLAMRALAAGAIDIVPKPRISASGATDDNGLLDVVRAAAQARIQPPRYTRSNTLPGFVPPKPRRAAPEGPPASATKTGSFRVSSDAVIAIGASTGGTEALKEILRAMPHDAPGIVIVQHMPVGFTAAFAEHLADICKMEVKEAEQGDRVVRGRALVARGDRHLKVLRRGYDLVVELEDSAPVLRHRPSVDVLFRSVAENVGPKAVGVILTGMGADGAEGLLTMKRAGAATIAQDEATCVVFGMPKEAIDRGAVDVVLPLPRIAAGILQRAPEPSRARTADAGG